jgi:hypothetical protein
LKEKQNKMSHQRLYQAIKQKQRKKKKKSKDMIHRILKICFTIRYARREKQTGKRPATSVSPSTSLV